MAVDLTKISKSKIPKETVINISIISGMLILAIALWFIVISPRLQKISELKNKINSISKLSTQKINILSEEKANLAKEKNNLSNKLILAEKELKKTKDISRALDSFLSTAKERKLEFTYIKPLSSTKETLTRDDITVNIIKTPIILEMEAEFTEFLGFLWEAEQSEQASRIVDLTIEKPDAKTLQQKIKLTMNIYRLDKTDE